MSLLRPIVKRTFLVAVLIASYSLASANEQDANEAKTIKIAMLHLELKYADLDHNAQLIERGIELAAKYGADWVMTPELALTGYRFDLKLGTDWITHGPDKYVQKIKRLAKKHELIIFLSHLEGINSETDSVEKQKVFNTLFVIDRSGKIIGRHRKINTIPIAESWSTAGTEATVVGIDQHKVGLLICADAWPTTHAQRLKEKGANIIVSSASWAPGQYGPADTWEKRSLETGLPLFVNNRTGLERQFDLRKSITAVSYQGRRLVSHQSPDSQVVIINWNLPENSLHSRSNHIIGLK